MKAKFRIPGTIQFTLLLLILSGISFSCDPGKVETKPLNAFGEIDTIEIPTQANDPQVYLYEWMNDSIFEARVLKSPVPVLVDFWATWCSGCRRMDPIVEQVATDYWGKMRLVKVNASRSHRLINDFNVKGLPVFLVFVDGELKEKNVGIMDKGALVKLFSPYL